MMIIRPIAASDFRSLWEIAKETGAGFTSLQPDKKVVTNKLQWARDSLERASAGKYEPQEELLYLFVMEDTETGEVLGTAGIQSSIGLTAPWYNYKINKQVHSSRTLNVYTMVETLTLCNDHTGFSELCTLYLKPEARHSGNGALLSKSRFMFMAMFPELFSHSVIAEMRGYCDENDVSPFWEALGRHFFAVDFMHADRHATSDKAVVAELMPRHPIYTNLLSEEAQQVIGLTHESTTPARRLLESEGFRYTDYVDIFDAGPLLESRIQDIRSVRDSRLYKSKIVENPTTDERLWLIANTKLAGFCCTSGCVSFEGFEFVNISQTQAEALNIQDGELLRVVPLKSQKSE